ncbi:T9SS type A sorting domain-containing protein [Haloflavibacter putidus]|uniref:T9SS type A sorting domain-containing protein n=2 Tax=Haloflavibacter putidus TaxID=2576776 RepID=A0A507ZVY5_9FLAO|nr:T9SS type A sorting domain-containing protein [Haloflavibacter putidus]
MNISGYGVFPGYGQGLDFTLNIEDNTPFPSPYCDIDADGTTVEEITTVSFAESDIANTNTSAILVDETSVTATLSIGETYTLTVGGNTAGDFNNNIVAFIDWNQNAILDDANEIYEVGTITNSTGNDSNTVSMDITVPADALPGNTRIRITKTYTDNESIAEIDPCAIAMNISGYGVFPGYGQGLDFTLNVGELSTNVFETSALSVYPVPTQDILNINYKTDLQTVKVYNLLGQEVYTKSKLTSQTAINLSGLSNGVYVVKVFTEKGQHSFKIVKQ